MPTLVLQDDFAGSDGVTLNGRTPTVGGNWTKASGTVDSWYTTTGGKAYSSGIAFAGVFVDVGAADVSIACDLAIVSGSFMLVRVASDAADFTGGMLVRLNAASDLLEVLTGGGSVIASASLTVDTATTYPATIYHYKGHVVFTVGGVTIHGWVYDYILGGPDSGYTALIPTGTRVGPDWTNCNTATMDNIVVYSLARADAIHISCIGDSITPFDRSAAGWPKSVAEDLNSGITQLRTYCGGGEGLSKVGTSGNSALIQAQNIVTNSDDPDHIIIHIGTNDDAASVAAATPNTVEALMDELLNYLINTGGYAASKIKVMEILPNSIETYHASNRAEIAASVASHPGVTLWDTTDWINHATDTDDGLHPNATGHGKIATRILSNLAVVTRPRVLDLTLLGVG